MKQKYKKNVTPEELRRNAAIHKEAVRLRKLPDDLLVRAASAKTALLRAQTEKTGSGDGQESPAVASGASVVCAEGAGAGRDTGGVKRLLEALEEGRCPGVKGATTYKVSKLAQEMGLV